MSEPSSGVPQTERGGNRPPAVPRGKPPVASKKPKPGKKTPIEPPLVRPRPGQNGSQPSLSPPAASVAPTPKPRTKKIAAVVENTTVLADSTSEAITPHTSTPHTATTPEVFSTAVKPPETAGKKCPPPTVKRKPAKPAPLRPLPPSDAKESEDVRRTTDSPQSTACVRQAATGQTEVRTPANNTEGPAGDSTVPSKIPPNSTPRLPSKVAPSPPKVKPKTKKTPPPLPPKASDLEGRRGRGEDRLEEALAESNEAVSSGNSAQQKDITHQQSTKEPAPFVGAAEELEIPRETTPAVESQVETTSAIETTPTIETQVETTPVIETQVETTSAIETTPTIETQVETTPAIETQVETTPAIETHIETTPAIKTQVETTPAIETKVETTSVIETQVETTPLQTSPLLGPESGQQLQLTQVQDEPSAEVPTTGFASPVPQQDEGDSPCHPNTAPAEGLAGTDTRSHADVSSKGEQRGVEDIEDSSPSEDRGLALLKELDILSCIEDLESQIDEALGITGQTGPPDLDEYTDLIQSLKILESIGGPP